MVKHGHFKRCKFTLRKWINKVVHCNAICNTRVYITTRAAHAADIYKFPITCFSRFYISGRNNEFINFRIGGFFFQLERTYLIDIPVCTIRATATAAVRTGLSQMKIYISCKSKSAARRSRSFLEVVGRVEEKEHYARDGGKHTEGQKNREQWRLWS